MDAAQTLLFDEPLGPALIAVSIVLVLSLVGPPWLRVVGHDGDTPGLIDRWALFAWVHPVRAALLKWTAVLVLGAGVSISAAIILQEYDVVGSIRHAVESVFARIWKTNRDPEHG